MNLAADNLCVRRLRLANSGSDALTWPHRIGAVLSAASLEPGGVPKQAILCIHKLRDPLPGTLRLNHARGGPPMAWRQAVTKALTRLAREAARPATGVVPANANAVLFLDPAEMLVCLAKDWSEGSAASCWWWRSLLHTTDVARGWLQTWLEASEYVPAALQRLAEQRNAVPFVRSLSASQARTLLESIAQKFGLAALLATVQSERFDGSPNGKRETAPIADHALQETKRSAAQNRPTLRPPWHPWVTDFENDFLTLERRLLLVVSLMLYRAPAVVRHPVFATEIVRWELELAANDQGKVSTPLEKPPVAEAGAETSPPTPRRHDELNLPTAAPGGDSRSESTPPAPTSQPSITPIRSASLSQSSFANALPNVSQSSDDASAPRNGTSAPWSRRCVSSAELVETEFGGVFYLINLGLFLNLYGDFTSPLRPGLALPILDFIALVGGKIVGERLRADPLWDLLARLSGRLAKVEPGDGFAAPQDWEVPKDWSTFQQTEAALITPSALSRVVTGLAEWFEWLMPYLRWRLLRALGLGNSAELSRMLCEQPARLSVTETHLDVTFALARLPIQVRLAGLDRNPGWVPAAGRFIAFHYE